MKSKLHLLLVIVALLCLAGWSGYGGEQRSSAGRLTWEYLVESAHNDTDAAQRELNRRGAEGWEFVARDASFYYFKRAR
jgi:hypothetical protein